MLKKLDLILKLVWDCNSTLKRIKSQGESRHINNISSDDAREPEVVYEAELDLDVSEPAPEVDESDTGSEVEDSLIETPVGVLAEPIIELLPSSPVMRVPLSLRPPDLHDPLQIFLNEVGSQEFGVLVCGSVFSGADLSCFAAFILLELPLSVADLSRKPVSPPPLWLRHDASVPFP